MWVGDGMAGLEERILGEINSTKHLFKMSCVWKLTKTYTYTQGLKVSSRGLDLCAGAVTFHLSDIEHTI